MQPVQTLMCESGRLHFVNDVEVSRCHAEKDCDLDGSQSENSVCIRNQQMHLNIVVITLCSRADNITDLWNRG